MFDSRTVSFENDQEITIGRGSSCDPKREEKESNLYIKDSTMSKNHALILFKDEKFYIKDTKSLHGTFVNLVKLVPEEYHVLEDGDCIGFVDLKKGKHTSYKEYPEVKMTYQIKKMSASPSLRFERCHEFPDTYIDDLSASPNKSDFEDDNITQKELSFENEKDSSDQTGEEEEYPNESESADSPMRPISKSSCTGGHFRTVKEIMSELPKSEESYTTRPLESDDGNIVNEETKDSSLKMSEEIRELFGKSMYNFDKSYSNTTYTSPWDSECVESSAPARSAGSVSSAKANTRRRRRSEQKNLKPFFDYLSKKRETIKSAPPFPTINLQLLRKNLKRKRHDDTDDDAIDSEQHNELTHDTDTSAEPINKKQKVEITYKKLALVTFSSACIASATTIGVLGAIGSYLSEA